MSKGPGEGGNVKCLRSFKVASVAKAQKAGVLPLGATTPGDAIHVENHVFCVQMRFLLNLLKCKVVEFWHWHFIQKWGEMSVGSSWY